MQWQIMNEDIVSAFHGDLEGRLEVMQDDDLQDSNDYHDANAVFDALGDIRHFPARIVLSDAQSVQLFITLENVIDLNDECDEHIMPALKRLYAQMKDEGYPH